MIKFLILILLSSKLYAYTLNNNFGASFSSSTVEISVDEQTTCSRVGVTVYDLKDMIKKAAKQYWNKVPTSDLKLKVVDFNQPIANISTGILCAPTDDDCITQAGYDVIAPVNGIVVACNSHDDNFDTNSVLAITVPNNFSGRKIKGAVVLLNNKIGTQLANLSDEDKAGVIAHEIGHALGLGHTNDKSALMYYRTVDQRKKLGEDDMRGISYLYPTKLDFGGLLGGCGTIDSNNKNPPRSSSFFIMMISLGGSILLFELIRYLKRAQTRSAL